MPPHDISWRFILILSSDLCPHLPGGLLPSRLPTKTLCASLLSLIHATCADNLIILDLITPMITGEECRAYNSSLCSLLHSPVTSSLLGSNILLSTLFSNTLSLCSFLSVSDQASHPYKTTGNITVLNILIFVFLATKLEDKRFCTEW